MGFRISSSLAITAVIPLVRGRKFLQYRNIKCHGCHGKGNASPAYIAIGFRILWIRIYKIGKVDMLDHNTFWFSGGTGCVDHISQVLWFRSCELYRKCKVFGFCCHVIQADHILVVEAYQTAVTVYYKQVFCLGIPSACTQFCSADIPDPMEHTHRRLS